MSRRTPRVATASLAAVDVERVLGILGECRHPALGPLEGHVVHSDQVGEVPGVLREGLHDPRDPKAAAVALARILSGSELRYLRPRFLGEFAVTREAVVPEHLGVADDGLVEHVPRAVELPGEEALGQRRRVRLRLDAGIEVQLFEARDRVTHLATGIVDVVECAFGEFERMLGEVDDIAAVALLELGFEHVGRFLDAADVVPDLPIGDELPVGKGLLDQRAQGRGVRPGARRRRGPQQQLAGQSFVIVGVVDQKLDQLSLGKRLEMGTRVIERRRGIVVLALSSEGDRNFMERFR